MSGGRYRGRGGHVHIGLDIDDKQFIQLLAGVTAWWLMYLGKSRFRAMKLAHASGIAFVQGHQCTPVVIDKDGDKLALVRTDLAEEV